MNEDLNWHGYSKEDIYGAQDDCLIAISRKQPVPTRYLQRIPPHRASLISNIAAVAGTGLEQGTNDQLLAEAEMVGSNGKLGDWWKRK